MLLLEQLLDQCFEQLWKNSALYVYQALLGDASASSGDSTSSIYNFSDVSVVLTLAPVNQCTKTVWKVWLCLSIITYSYKLGVHCYWFLI